MTDKSKDFSLSGAVVGGALFGNVGAAIGSQKDNNKYEVTTEKQDSVHTYIYYQDNGEIKTIDVEGKQFAQYIKRVLPEKDFAVVQHSQQSQSQPNVLDDSIESKLSKVKQLYESGLINEVEYEQKRKELLDSL